MLFKNIIAVNSENHTKHKYKTQHYRKISRAYTIRRKRVTQVLENQSFRLISLCLESGRFIHYRLAGPDIASPEPQLTVFFRVLEGPSQLLWQCQGLSPRCTSPPYKRSLTWRCPPPTTVDPRNWKRLKEEEEVISSPLLHRHAHTQNPRKMEFCSIEIPRM
jgi:hypothetical protein